MKNTIMKNNRFFALTIFSVALIALFSVVVVGCNSTSQDSTASNSKTSTENGADNGDMDHDAHHDDAGAMNKMEAELAKLSPEDAASGKKQHFCPVSDEMLGSMGPPKKVDVNGQQVWICCDHCKDALLKDPDKYLAKLDKSKNSDGGAGEGETEK